MPKEDKILDIDYQINKLQVRKKRLEEKRKLQMSAIISRCGASTLPDDVLAGAILDAVKAYTTKDHRLSSWKEEGQRIVRPGRGRRKNAA